MSEVIVPSPDDLLLNELRLYTPSQLNRSAWTGTRKVVGLPGAEVWRGSASIDVITTEFEERQWRAFLFGLRGPINWFRWVLPCNKHPGARPIVAPGATAYSLPMTGMEPNTLILSAGQFMTIPLSSGNVRAVVLMADLFADVAGGATAVFEPAMTVAPPPNAIVETLDPFIPMSLVDPEQGFSRSNGVSSASFEVEETR